MKFRVEGTLYDFGLLEEEEHDRLLSQWHRSKRTERGAAVECLCHGEKHTPNPLLYVKRVKDGLFLANYPTNSKKEIVHDFKCRFNRFGYRSMLEETGIRVGENEIVCTLDLEGKRPHIRSEASRTSPASAKLNSQVRKEREQSDRKAKLPMLFLAMLQEYKVTEFNPAWKRNIANRLKKIAKIVQINKMSLSDILYVASTPGNWPKKDRHQLIIGWGHRSIIPKPHPTNPKFIRLPLFSVDDPSNQVTEVSMLKSIYESCVYMNEEVKTGYYLLFRGPVHQGDKNIWDRQLHFIPAEEHTRIPVESAHEESIIRSLYGAGIHFEKPLIGNVTDLFLDLKPDIILHDTSPKTIIETSSRDVRGYVSRVEMKKASYSDKGYQYIEWDFESHILTKG